MVELQKVLVTVIGPDTPGITAAMSGVLAENHARLLDIEQVVVQGQLTLCMLIGVSPETAVGEPVIKDLLFRAKSMGLDLQFKIIDQRVGALPAFPTNALKYNLTWSVDGLINEYCHPCEAIHDGQPVELLPLEGLEHFSLDGTEYEAFSTSGGLGTLCSTLAGRVRTLDYKSVRYPGHGALMKMLLEDLRLKDEPALLKDILRKSVPATMQDVVLVFVTVSGIRRGTLVQEVFARKVFADRSETRPRSAIQITTAAGICAALDLFREGALPQAGFIRQEQIALPSFLANRFGRAYQQSRQVESIS